MATATPSNKNQGNQTPVSSRFPPASTAQLIKDRGSQKQRHTKLVSKIRSHIEQGGDTSNAIQWQKNAFEILESMEALNRRLLAAPDYKEDEDEPRYMDGVRKLTTEVGREVDRYVQQTLAYRQSALNQPSVRTRSTGTQSGANRDDGRVIYTGATESSPSGQTTGKEAQETLLGGVSVTEAKKDSGVDQMQQAIQAMINRFETVLETERQDRKQTEHSYRDLLDRDRKERVEEQRRFRQSVEDRLSEMERRLNRPSFGATGLAKETGAIPKSTSRYALGAFREEHCEPHLFTTEDEYGTIQYNLKYKTHQSTPSDEEKKRKKKNETVEPKKTNSNPENRWTLRRVCDDTSSQPDTTVTRRSIFRAPRIDVTPFDGNPTNWPDFVATFNSLIESDPTLSVTEKMGILRRCLTADIRASLGDCVQDPNMFDEAVAELQATYGHPHVISRTYVRRIKDLPKINSIKDYDDLLRFSITLRGAVTTLRSGGYAHELTPGLVDTVLDKLPIEIQSRWGERIVNKFPEVLTMADFEPWLHKLVQAQMVIKHGKCTTKNTGDRKQGRPGSGKNDSRSSPTILTTSIPAAVTGSATTSTPSSRAVAPPTEKTPSKPKIAVCIVCKGPHKLSECKEFSAKAIEERTSIIKSNGCCLGCLNRGHLMKECRSKTTCPVEGCRSQHHRLLHGAPRIFAGEEKSATTVAIGTATIRGSRPPTLLCIVPVTIKSDSGESMDTYALIDNGAEATLITTKAARQLKLSGPVDHLRLSSIHGQDPVLKTQNVAFSILSRDQSKSFKVSNAIALKKLVLSDRRINWPALKREWRHISDIDLPAINSELVTVLLGRDTRGVHDIYETRRTEDESEPEAVLTPFGWCVTGTIPTRVLHTLPSSPSIHQLHPAVSKFELLTDSLERFWTTESFGVIPGTKAHMSAEEKKGLDILEATIRHNGERYEVGLMWKSKDVKLPDNKSDAMRQFVALERRFQRNPDYAQKYHKAVSEYISLGHARRLNEDESAAAGRIWYLPHHGVTSPSKPGKVRVVFNCSARYQGTSLNDVLLTGPDLLTSSNGVLMRFRLLPIAVMADIEKMYHQVRVIKEDQSVLRFLYRPPGSSSKIVTYVMTVHVFGSAASPTTCIFALRRTAEDMRTTYPHVADLVKNNVYVDNLLYSTETEEEAIRDSKDFKSLCKHGGFNVVQWMSTSRKLLATIDTSELAQPIKNLEHDPLPVERVLGMLLDCQADEFIYRVTIQSVSTMREALQAISSIYDPLGLISAVILQARILLRECWRLKCSWDQPLPSSIADSWQQWSSTLNSLSQLRIPRCLRRTSKPSLQEIHSFSDASEQGFGACIYLRSVYGPDEVDVRLIIAKSRVAPLRQLSIPRLELQGALMSSRLTETVRQELNWKGAVFYWCDSQTTLQWIHSSSCRFHAFVAHRVTEIIDHSHPRQWRHIPGPLNPADDASRGISPSELSSDHRWFQGPDFLRSQSEAWPSVVTFPEPETDDPEVSTTSWIGTVTPEQPHPLTELTRRSSSLPRFKRTVAWMLRLKRKFALPHDAPPLPRWLTAPEICAAWNLAVRLDQKQHFPREIATLKAGKLLPPESPLYELSPYFDTSGILRVSGRLEHAPIDDDTKHPVILHHQSHLARLVIIDTHAVFIHSSVERTISQLRVQFYILRVRQVVRSIVGHCFECKRRNAQPAPPIMAPLPANRLKPFNPPFTCTGIDYFGPLEVVMFRRTVKRYGVLFTCMTTRAVHLEIAHSLDTDSFLMAFWRFSNRRGCPATVYSDNGTNLTAGERVLRESIDRLDSEKIANETSSKNINWHFSPPAAPHFGGAWERLVRSAKTALRIVLKNRTVNDEVLHSAMVGVEALLNDRPLTHVSVDPRDLEALTPNHFLLGRSNPNRPPDVILQTETLSAKSWRTAQVIITQFWHRWLREYIPELIERRIWLKPRRNLTAGDIVLIVDPATRRGEWPIGRVLESHAGPDGVVRSASIQTANGITVRPTVKLCLLESEPSEKVFEENRAGYVADDAPHDTSDTSPTPAP